MELVSATQFDEGTCWYATLVPAAGELTARYGPGARCPTQGAGGPVDAEKSARDRLRRAQRRIRRFVVANRLGWFLTLTFAESPATVAEAADEVTRFFRRVVYRFSKVPFVWSLETGSQRGRIHAHALVGGLGLDTLQEAWSLGRLDQKDFGNDATSLRAAAGYLSKDLDRGPLLDRQAYRVAKGFQPEEIRLGGLRDPQSVICEASHLMGADPTSVDDSARGASLTALWDVGS